MAVNQVAVLAKLDEIKSLIWGTNIFLLLASVALFFAYICYKRYYRNLANRPRASSEHRTESGQLPGHPGMPSNVEHPVCDGPEYQNLSGLYVPYNRRESMRI